MKGGLILAQGSSSFQPISQSSMATFCQLPNGHSCHTLDCFMQRSWQFCRSSNWMPCFHCSAYKLRSSTVNSKISNWLILQDLGLLWIRLTGTRLFGTIAWTINTGKIRLTIGVVAGIIASWAIKVITRFIPTTPLTPI